MAVGAPVASTSAPALPLPGLWVIAAPAPCQCAEAASRTRFAVLWDYNIWLSGADCFWERLRSGPDATPTLLRFMDDLDPSLETRRR